jgi:uncharacterized repeat protein (TIGR01451 family)
MVLLLALVPASTRAQGPPPPLPGQGPAPLLYVRIAGPAGMHVTVYQGQAPPHDYVAPVTIGLRPGYLHRLRLSALPDLPGVTLAPTLEVRGTLHLSPRLHAANYPAPVVFTEQDINHVLAGAFLNKVIYLENPDLAVATATRADQPLEMNVPSNRDLLAEARGLGRPMLLLRLGQRDLSNEELAKQTLPGTVLLPDERVLGVPPLPPYLPWSCVQVYDPILGPRPLEEECLRDGGDAGRPVGIDAKGRLQGLDPADSVAEYADSHGRRHVTPSNCVCICVPRFAVLRSEVPLAGYDVTVGPAGAQLVLGQEQLRTRVPAREAHQNEQPVAVKGRQQASANIATQGLDGIVRVEVLNAHQLELGPAAALCTKQALLLTEVERTRLTKQLELARNLSTSRGPRGVEQLQGTAVVGRVEGLSIVSATAETRDLTVCCNEVPHAPEKPLILFKWANAQAAQVGDTVTFYLKYSNHGGQPITDVAVSDSLTGRLEYVPGSAKSDRDAVFTTQENEAGSLILRWEVSGRLLPGQSGVVSFQAKVR